VVHVEEMDLPGDRSRHVGGYDFAVTSARGGTKHHRDRCGGRLVAYVLDKALLARRTELQYGMAPPRPCRRWARRLRDPVVRGTQAAMRQHFTDEGLTEA
jgi:hypothetical protein